jgi:hypothetical protein
LATPPTRRKKLFLALILVILALGAAASFWLMRRGNGPASARLLPEGEAIVYLNLRPLRVATHFGEYPVSREPDYEQFVQATGFQFERDLDEVALVVHPAETGIDSGVQVLEHRYSEVFVGRYDPAKLTAYLKSLSADAESIAGQEVFAIPHEGRTVRVALLSDDTVAVSNSSDSGNLRHIIEAFHGAVTATGPSLLRDYHDRLPMASGAWAIAKLTTPDGSTTSLPLPGGLNFTLPKNTVTVFSLGANASLASGAAAQLKAEAITPSEADAKQVTESVSSFLQLFRAIESSSRPAGPDPDVKKFFESLQIQQKGSSAVLTAELPVGFLKKVLAEAPVTNNAVEKNPQIERSRPEAKPKTNRQRAR